MHKPEHRYKVLELNSLGQVTWYCVDLFERYEKKPLE